MNWYAAHIVMVVKYKSAQQERFPAWENVVLLRAVNEASALTKAETIGLECAGDDDGAFRWAGKAATWQFAGVRKITECALAGEKPASGDEITYSELIFSSLAEANRYAQGAAITVLHDDQIQPLDSANKLPAVRSRRKPA